jgi:hypothetical protein
MHELRQRQEQCVICNKLEQSPGTFPRVIGLGRVCMECGMKKVKCDVCGEETKIITSSRFQGKTLCLRDHVKEIEKYRNHIIVTYDENKMNIDEIVNKALHSGPEGYTLLSIRRARNSRTLWEAEYEKTEIFDMRCS